MTCDIELTGDRNVSKSVHDLPNEETEKNNVHTKAPDGGWGWVIVFSSLTAGILYDGVTYSFGILTTEFISYYEVSRTMIGIMGSVLVGMTLCTGPLVSALCDRYGYRFVTVIGGVISSLSFAAPFFYSNFWFLILTATVLTGLGFGMVYLASVIIVNIYFDKKRGLAVGISVCGAGIGAFIFSPLTEYFIQEYGWQGSMLLIGGILLNLIPCGLLYRPIEIAKDVPLPSESTDVDIENKAPSASNQTFLKSFVGKLQVFANPIFAVFAISNFLSNIGYNAPFLYAKDRALNAGISPVKSSFLISSIGIGNCLGRVSFGYLASTKYVNRFHLYNVSLIICGLSLIASWGIVNYGLMICYTFVFGAMSGSFITLTSLVLIDILGLNNLNFAFGVLNIIQGIAVLIGPPIAGYVYDMTGSFDAAFLFCGAFLSASGLILFLPYLLKYLKKK